MNVYNWLRVGVKTVFPQDAGNMTLSTTKLIEVMLYLKQVFPGLGRITCYARAKSLVKKDAEKLEETRKTGLSRLHVCLEIRRR